MAHPAPEVVVGFDRLGVDAKPAVHLSAAHLEAAHMRLGDQGLGLSAIDTEQQAPLLLALTAMLP